MIEVIKTFAMGLPLGMWLAAQETPHSTADNTLVSFLVFGIGIVVGALSVLVADWRISRRGRRKRGA